MSREKFEKSPRFKEITNSISYLKVPLKKKLTAEKFKTLTYKGVQKGFAKRFEDFKDELDPRNLTDIQREESAKDRTIESLTSMYNEFNISDTTRERMLEAYGTNYFEINLDTLTLEVVFSRIRENTMNRVLPLVNSLASQLKVHAHRTGQSKDVEDALQDLYDQLRISIYGINPIKSEFVEPLGVIQQVQKLASVLFITMRPVLFVKELIGGTFRNVSYA